MRKVRKLDKLDILFVLRSSRKTTSPPRTRYCIRVISIVYVAKYGQHLAIIWHSRLAWPVLRTSWQDQLHAQHLAQRIDGKIRAAAIQLAWQTLGPGPI